MVAALPSPFHCTFQVAPTSASVKIFVHQVSTWRNKWAESSENWSCARYFSDGRPKIFLCHFLNNEEYRGLMTMLTMKTWSVEVTSLIRVVMPRPWKHRQAFFDIVLKEHQCKIDPTMRVSEMRLRSRLSLFQEWNSKIAPKAQLLVCDKASQGFVTAT